MIVKILSTIFVCCFSVHVVAGLYISNLNETCIQCLCDVVGCDLYHGCTGEYCGPFYISKAYWIDAGKPTLLDDNPERTGAYEECAREYFCSRKIIENYMAKFGKDCNNDGVTDCFDYMMINHNGPSCSAPLHSSELGRQRLQLFQQCRFNTTE